MPLFVTVVLGCVFAILGKWLYSNPQRLAPQWMPGADAKSVNDLARFFGIALVFVGIASGGFALSEIIHGNFIGYILVLVGAPIFTWLIFRNKKAGKSL